MIEIEPEKTPEEVFTEWHENGEDDYELIGYMEGLLKRAEEAERKLAEMTLWTPCSERLPDKTGWYIVCYAGVVTVALAFWNNNQQYFNQAAPRYWQPLPQPPEEE